MQIDSTVVWLSTEDHIVFPDVMWSAIRQTFIERIIELDGLDIDRNGKYHIADKIIVDGVLSFMSKHLFIYKEAFMSWALDQIPEERHTQSCCGFESVMYAVFDTLMKDRVTKKAFKDHAQKVFTDRFVDVVMWREAAQHSLRMHYDDELGMEVQFIVPRMAAHQLYYVVASGLYMIPDVRKYDSKTTASQYIGPFTR